MVRLATTHTSICPTAYSAKDDTLLTTYAVGNATFQIGLTCELGVAPAGSTPGEVAPSKSLGGVWAREAGSKPLYGGSMLTAAARATLQGSKVKVCLLRQNIRLSSNTIMNHTVSSGLHFQVF